MHNHLNENHYWQDVGLVRYYQRYSEYETVMAEMALSEKMSVSPKSRDSKGESVSSSPDASPQDHSRQKLRRSPQSNSSSSGYNGSESSTEQMPSTFSDNVDSPESGTGSCRTQSTYVPVASSRSPGSDVSEESTNMATEAVKEEMPKSPKSDVSVTKPIGRGYPGIFLPTPCSNFISQAANPAAAVQDSWNMGSVPLQQNVILDLTNHRSPPPKDNLPHPRLANSNNKFGLFRHSLAQDDRDESPLAKRMKLLESSKQFGAFDWQPQSPTNATASSSSSCSDNNDLKRRRFMRTREALERSGLLNITMRTADLIKSNYVLNKQIEELKSHTAELLRSIFECPENEKATKSLNILKVISDQSRDSKQEPM